MKRPRYARGSRFVTALCLTRNRREWLPKAIKCYQQQTYPNRELLIVADGEDVRDLVPPDDKSIRLIHVEENRCIGEKRNFGCDRAAGGVVAHWDDDDNSAPGRLADQIGRLISSGLPVTGYSSMRFSDPDGVWWKYTGQPKISALGTSLCYRREWQQAHPFLALQVGEDNRFVSAAADAGQLSTIEAGDLMTATIHDRNTSPRNLAGSAWRKL